MAAKMSHKSFSFRLPTKNLPATATPFKFPSSSPVFFFLSILFVFVVVGIPGFVWIWVCFLVEECPKMPLLKKNSFPLSHPLPDLRPDELVFQIPFTGEVFRSYPYPLLSTNFFLVFPLFLSSLFLRITSVVTISCLPRSWAGTWLTSS